MSDLNDYDALAQYAEDLRRKGLRRRAEAEAINAAPRGASRLPDGTLITDEELSDNIANAPGVAPPAPAPQGREQFGLAPLPAPKTIGRAPGDGVPSVAFQPYTPAPSSSGYAPAAPAGFTPAAPSAPASGGSGYGDAIQTINALAQSLYRMGQPGDHSGALDPLTALPGQLQQRRLNDQRLAANDMELQQQQALQAQLPAIQQQIASLPPELRFAAEAAARRGDTRALASIMHTAGAMRGARGAAGANVGPNGEKAPNGYHFVDGQLTYIPGGPRDPANAKPDKMTEAQSKDAFFADRAAEADKTLLALTGDMTDVVGGSYNQHAPNVMLGKKGQQSKQAAMAFGRAILRKETGAAYTDKEVADIETMYIPLPGDKPDVIAQKAQQRQIAIDAMRRGAGPSYVPRDDGAATPAPSGGNATVREGTTATNKATGERIIMRNGRWEKL